MKPPNNSQIFLTAILTWLLGIYQPVAAKQPPNVLFIAIDDLRPELHCYGATHIHSPNIDALAASGRRFERAYCQQAVCNPSRTSLMVGMRPDSIGITGNHAHFRSKHPNVVTLPQHFKNNGYYSAAIGKIYHGVFPEGSSNTKWDTMGDPESWSVPAIRFGPRYYYTEQGIAEAKESFRQVYKPIEPARDDWTRKLVFGLSTEAPDVPDNVLYDGKVADAAVAALKAAVSNEEPFFLAVGFIKPHSPYIAPKKYFDLYENVKLATRTKFPIDAPSLAGHASGELRRYTDQPRSGKIPADKQRRVRQAYFACVSYIDSQVGGVLDELERSGLSENTIVVLFGDHGYHLGDQGLWGKTTNFELDARVPLIVRTPEMKASGTASSSLVELVDLYPTLAELAGLPQPDHLEGNSFAPILEDPAQVTKACAISQYPRGGGLMGYSVRTNKNRLTQWISRQTGIVQANELYEYTDGLVETKNIANESPELVDLLSKQLFDAVGHTPNHQSKPTLLVATSSNEVSFEQSKPGEFNQLQTAIGVWSPHVGRSIVDDKHAKTGVQCLQLLGGAKTSVTLDLADDADTSGELIFWAERWTKRDPFSFRIEAKSLRGWKEIYNGDNQIRVGRSFLSQVRLPLGDKDITQLRFNVVSPTNTGILIDDVRLAPAVPQKIVGAETIPLTLPALVGAADSALVKLKVTTTGSLNPISMTELRGAVQCNSGDVESVQVYFGGSNDRFVAKTTFGSQLKITDRDQSISATGKQELVEGDNYVWLTCQINEAADIDHRVGAYCKQIAFSNGKTIELGEKSTFQRIGVAVRRGGDGGVHTFRIPGLATTNQGTLIGVYDVRHRSGGDLPGDIDVGMSRSTDGGRSWQAMKTIMDMGDDPDWHYDGIGDPAILVDQQTGTIWVAATWSHGNRSWRGSGQGLSPDETGQLMLVRSDDDGETWSKPINITKQIKKPEWCFVLQGPGKGITMRDGTIVFAAQFQDPPSSQKQQHRLPHSTIIYSQDHGATWQVGTRAFDDTTESQVVEIEPGTLMLNCRYNRKSTRVVMTTRDLGKTWTKHTTSERALIEPGSCMASLIDVDREVGVDLGQWLLFSNPDSTRGRHHITIKASPDRGMTWPKESRLLLDEGTSAGYSCMSMIDDKTIGILYEGSQAHMTFQRVPLSDVLGPQAVSAKSASAPSSKSTIGRTKLQLPQSFGDHMVLQANVKIPVWGIASPGATVKVSLANDLQFTQADDSGKWRVEMKPCKITGLPITLSVTGNEQQIEFTDVLIGEVWVCAGQSNMEWPLSQSQGGKDALANLDSDANLRLLHLVGAAVGSSGAYGKQQLGRLTPDKFSRGHWKVATPESAGNFSAVAIYFGRRLQAELGVPIGLICAAIGGTPTEAWIPRKALQEDPSLKGLVAGSWLDNQQLSNFCRTRGQQNLLTAMQAGERIPGDELGPNHSFKPGFMWEAGIEPLIPHGIRGVIWYQGESNAETRARTREHQSLFRLLVGQWRDHWDQGDFPFLYVQLPAMGRSEWPAFREGQRRAIDQLENVGMAVTIDTGDSTNVHPTLKKPVGERLARWALGTTYQVKSYATYSGPLFRSIEPNGNQIIVNFDHVGKGLASSNDKPLCHFEVAGGDGVFHSAIAKFSGKDSIIVSSSMVPKPVTVRYAWVPFPDPVVNLVNSVGLPASPFTSQNRRAQ